MDGAQAETKPVVSKKREKETDAELNLLMSSEGMNLAAVRTNAEHLQKAMQRTMKQVEHNAGNLTWQDMIGQFAVLNVQFFILTKEFRPLLRHYVVHPNSVNAEVAAELPVLLSTKLLPEMEHEEAALLKQYQRNVLGQDIGTQCENLQKKIDHHNGLCERADSLLQTLREGAVSKRQRTTTSTRPVVTTKGPPGKPPPQNPLLLAAHTGVGLLKQ
uniref:Mediator of RNA polymerase II transcription subunit 8 n=1 Tax=Pyramimonas obovata TaxID=1411642 RepID=A0A7S0N2P1_9CHLO|mmetsp:Transcript_17597/g.38380  ORF Transcript_17597/g.38380 Transcript_17597/m.38380 type:complete len:216 (+) Transcript_17597:380-1027(+)